MATTPAASADVARSVTIVDATETSPATWDAMAVRSPLGEAFQSHAWGELKRGLGWTPLRYAIELSGRRIGVVSLQERSIVAGRRILYAPRGPVLLEPDPTAATAALAGLRLIARQRHALALTIDPAWEEGSDLAGALAGSGFREASREIQVSRTAMVVPLAASEDAQRALLGHTTYSDIQRAIALGVTTERVDLADPAAREPALAEFFDIHAATGKREGFLVRDRDYELRQWRSLGESGVASLWFAGLARRDTGALLLHSGANVVYFAAGSRDDADMHRTRANHLLQWRIVRWAAEAGFGGYDMGGVDTQTAPGVPQDESHPLWNLYLFKRRFGGRPVLRIRAHECAPNAVLGVAWRLARRFR
ncbi:MAG: lipid II:glycine glycyltransferase FemX [Candidatus Limnocylindrales bacterium]